MSTAKVKQFFAGVRSAHTVNMTEEAATARLREIHEALSDRGGPLKWHERNRLEGEALDIKRAQEEARKKTAANQGSGPAVTVQSTPCGGRATRRSEVVTRRDHLGRPMVIMEYRDRRPLSPEQVLAEVERRIAQEIRTEVAGLESGVAANQERVDKLGLSPTLAVNRGAPPGFAPIRPAHEARIER
jgi:hypothetical protein